MFDKLEPETKKLKSDNFKKKANKLQLIKIKTFYNRKLKPTLMVKLQKNKE